MSSAVCVFGKFSSERLQASRENVEIARVKRRGIPALYSDVLALVFSRDLARDRAANYIRGANAVTPDTGCVTEMFNGSLRPRAKH